MAQRTHCQKIETMSTITATQNKRIHRTTIIFRLVLSILLISVGTTGAISSEENGLDACALQNYVYCQCEEQDREELDVKCFVYEGLETKWTPQWRALAKQRRTVSLSMNNRPTRYLNQLPPPWVFSKLPELKYFETELITLPRIPSFAFGNSTTLVLVKLVDNEVETLEPMAIAELPNLRQVNLGDNKLTEINRGVFVNLPKLKKLYLDQNQILTIHDRAFVQLEKLEELELQNNNLTVMARDVFKGLRNLRRLDLRKNMIEYLGDHVFADMTHLQDLDLMDNKIRFVSSAAFLGLKELARLTLKENKIVKLDPTSFRDFKIIHFLDLRQNELETLNEALMEPIYANLKNNTMQLMLEGNRLACSCEILWIKRLLNETRSIYVKNHLNRTTCDFFHKLGDKKGTQVEKGTALSYNTKNVTLVANTPEETSTYKYDGERFIWSLKEEELACHNKNKGEEKTEKKENKYYLHEDGRHTDDKESQRDAQSPLRDESGDDEDSIYTPMKDEKVKPGGEDTRKPQNDEEDHSNHHHNYNSRTTVVGDENVAASSTQVKAGEKLAGLSVFVFLWSSLYFMDCFPGLRR